MLSADNKQLSFKERVETELSQNKALTFTYHARDAKLQRVSSFAEFKGHRYFKDYVRSERGTFGITNEFNLVKDKKAKDNDAKAPTQIIIKRELPNFKNDAPEYPNGYDIANAAIIFFEKYGIGAFAGDLKDKTKPHYTLMPKLNGEPAGSIRTANGEMLIEILIHIFSEVRDFHASNYVHGDPHPWNILVEAHAAHLLDFDSARKAGETFRSFVGKQYAPELQDVYCVAHPSQDIYQLGYYMEELVNHLNCFLTNRVKKNALHQLASEMMRKKPEERPRAQTVLDRLKQIQNLKTSCYWCCSFSTTTTEQPEDSLKKELLTKTVPAMTRA